MVKTIRDILLFLLDQVYKLDLTNNIYFLQDSHLVFQPGFYWYPEPSKFVRDIMEEVGLVIKVVVVVENKLN